MILGSLLLTVVVINVLRQWAEALDLLEVAALEYGLVFDLGQA